LNYTAEDFDQNNYPREPRRNPDLLGQEMAEKILAASFSSGCLPHAWMFTGPKGIGKATLAFRFARHVLAHRPIKDTGMFPLEVSKTQNASEIEANTLYLAPNNPTFQRVAACGHSDLMTIEAGPKNVKNSRNTIGVDDVREISNFFRLTAGEGGWQVVIIDSADDMNVNAANALLKILEEPPPNALLLLVCHNPGRLLPTIRSRCQKLRLAQLDEATISELLALYMPHLHQDIRDRLATLSDGAIGRAIDLALANGLETQKQIMSFLRQVPKIDLAKLRNFSTQMGQANASVQFEAMANLLRRALWRLIPYASGSTIDNLDTEEMEVFKHLAKCAKLDRWLKVWEETNGLLDRANHYSLDRKYLILQIFFNLSKAARRN